MGDNDHDIEAALIQRDELTAWYRSLTASQREAVSLCWIGGYTQEEAAEMLGVTLRALQYRLRSARKTAADLRKTPSQFQ